ncbi:uncharacterized protein BX664DRAFT_341658, partial [Halteromyces radiatus]|uniref:uncharacterized protein n=1 Tax=Halteromyces radiatus TaxID=101107 RepID=UPI00221FA858
MISTLKPSSSTKRTKKPKPLFQSNTTSSLGSGTTVPLSSSIISNNHHTVSRGRPRSKSVGKHADQRTIARQQTFDKLCGQTTPPPLPPIPKQTTSTPTRRLRKYASAHDLEKPHNQPPPPLPISPHPLKKQPPLPSTPRHTNIKYNDDDDDDIPLAATLRRLPQSPRSPYYYHTNTSLLNDEQEDDDEDLVPIARLRLTDDKPSSFLKSAADKYKEKVKERLHLD